MKPKRDLWIFVRDNTIIAFEWVFSVFVILCVLPNDHFNYDWPTPLWLLIVGRLGQPTIWIISMFLKRAMRYYRVWIYSCNLALFTSTLVFIILSLWIASDFHLSLFPSVTFYQPSFIYAYMALTLQSGILQVRRSINCSHN